MKKYVVYENENTKQVNIVEGKLKSILNATEMDVEQAYNGKWYLKGYAPNRPAPTVQEQIEALENTITARNIRAAIQGDSFALSKIAEIESQIKELRKQL